MWTVCCVKGSSNRHAVRTRPTLFLSERKNKRVDYRQLKSTTRKDAFLLPRIDVCLDAMATAKWFSTFELRSSYHQVQVDP